RRRGGRHRDGEAGDDLPRHPERPATRGRRAPLRVSRERRVLHDQGRRGPRLDRRPRGGPRAAHRRASCGGRLRVDILRSRGRRGSEPMSTNQEWFERALRVIPGGVDSPVRSFRSVGGTPYTVVSGTGAYVTDVEGTTYIDF